MHRWLASREHTLRWEQRRQLGGWARARRRRARRLPWAARAARSRLAQPATRAARLPPPPPACAVAAATASITRARIAAPAHLRASAPRTLDGLGRGLVLSHSRRGEHCGRAIAGQPRGIAFRVRKWLQWASQGPRSGKRSGPVRTPGGARARASTAAHPSGCGRPSGRSERAWRPWQRAWPWERQAGQRPDARWCPQAWSERASWRQPS